jgi:hypothetical protein
LPNFNSNSGLFHLLNSTPTMNSYTHTTHIHPILVKLSLSTRNSMIHLNNGTTNRKAIYFCQFISNRFNSLHKSLKQFMSQFREENLINFSIEPVVTC